MEMIEVED